ncbi:4376_t:CDS:1, partial [Acaulospora morrowiae]
QVSDILKNKDQWLSIESEILVANFKRIYRVTYENIEEAIKIWIDNILSHDKLNLSDRILIEKAKEFAIEFNISDQFLALTEWVKDFK